MLNISNKMAIRKEMESFVDSCALRTPQEVSRLFLEYTLLIWAYRLVGKIADFYPDDILLHHAGGITVQGIDALYANTMAILAKNPVDGPMAFIDIFAEGNPEDGYRFCQATTNYISCDNGEKPDSSPDGPLFSDTEVRSVVLCECLVKKVNGRWKIMEEWLIRPEKTRSVP